MACIGKRSRRSLSKPMWKKTSESEYVILERRALLWRWYGQGEKHAAVEYAMQGCSEVKLRRWRTGGCTYESVSQKCFP